MAAKGGGIDFMFPPPHPATGSAIAQASICLQDGGCLVGEGGGVFAWSGCGWASGLVRPPSLPEMVNEGVGTHPTEMHYSVYNFY